MTDLRRAEERYGFDFSEEWDWGTLYARVSETDELDALLALRKAISLEEAQFLLTQISRLDDPNGIKGLADYQRLQEEWGGGFYGMLPDPLVGKELPVPTDLPSLIRAALLIAQARKENIEALGKVIPNYPLRFSGAAFPVPETNSPPGWAFKLDLSAVRGVLDLFCREEVTQETAAVASLPAFEEMMRHRRELGYIPEPLLTQAGLAHLLRHAASREPLDMIWKWLTPQNFFDLADLFFHQEEYAALIETIESHKRDLSAHILGTIGRYAPQGIVFQDRLAFTVGWGIAGWATSTTGGINIEHFKDDYNRLLRTLTHETFHRFQLRVCPAAPDREGPRRFEDLARFPFPDERDRKFYEIISYIFLEGTATFVAPSHPPVDRAASVKRGAELLQECFEAIYHRSELERAEELLNEGLKSNGPFYWLGANIAESIVAKGGDEALAAILAAGAPAFLIAGFSSDVSLHVPLKKIENKTKELVRMMSAIFVSKHTRT